jgi:hypothetical protein
MESVSPNSSIVSDKKLDKRNQSVSDIGISQKNQSVPTHPQYQTKRNRQKKSASIRHKESVRRISPKSQSIISTFTAKASDFQIIQDHQKYQIIQDKTSNNVNSSHHNVQESQQKNPLTKEYYSRNTIHQALFTALFLYKMYSVDVSGRTFRRKNSRAFRTS